MSSELWQQAKQALADALEMDEQQQLEFLSDLERQSPDLASEVRTLLEAAKSAEEDGFLDAPASDTADQQQAETIAHPGQQYDTVAPPTDRDATLVGPSLSGVPGHLSNLSEEYELQGQIGKGGMGEVYRAYQHSLRRHVALKIIPERYLPTPDQVARFKIEAESAASLDHPGIVPVYEVGERFGMHFYSMALVEGGSLADYVGRSKERLSHREAAELMEQVCHAVQYAHDRAVIHRDIKPANILLDKQRHPRLTDFGLAKLLEGEEELTMTGQVMGTPSYMAPEQAKGNQQEMSNRTDVYSLGATLYALLAGRPPFAAENAITTIREVMDKQPPALNEFAPGVPLDLQTICEKCLAKRPVDRYESADDLADDLRRYLDGFPIEARPQGALMRGYLWSRRNPALATLIGVTAATLVVATIVASMLAIRANRALAQAEANAQKLNQAIEELFVEVSENELFLEPGMQSIRETLLASAQRYYEELLTTGQTSIDKVARSAFLLGRVQAELGNRQAASTSFDTAIKYYEELLESQKEDPKLYASLAQVHNDYAALGEQHLFEMGARPAFELEPLSEEGLAALERWRSHAFQCTQFREKASELSPDDDGLQRLLANAKMNLSYAIVEEARTDGDAKGFERARTLNESAKEIRVRLLERDSAAVEVSIDLAKGFAAEADLMTAEAEAVEERDPNHKLWKEVFRLRGKAIDTLLAVPKSRSGSQLDWQLVNAYQKRADSAFLVWSNRQAIKDYENSERRLELLKVRNPRVTKYRKKLADSYFNHSQALLREKDPNGYLILQDCLDNLVGAVAIDPQDAEALNLLVSYSGNVVRELMADETVESLRTKASQILEYVIDSLRNLSIRKEQRNLIDATIKRLQETLDEINEPEDQLAMLTTS